MTEALKALALPLHVRVEFTQRGLIGYQPRPNGVWNGRCRSANLDAAMAEYEAATERPRGFLVALARRYQVRPNSIVTRIQRKKEASR